MAVNEISLLAVVLLGLVATISILRVTAGYLDWEFKIHDLKVEAHRLRAEYERRRNPVREQIECGVEIVDEEETAPPLAQAA